MKWVMRAVALSAMAVSAGGAWAQKGETVKVAWIDPLSGLMAAVGTNQLKTFQLLAEEFNKKNASGVKFEVVALDNKLSPQETTAALRSAMDQGVRYVTQGNGSGPALAIMDALEKHNSRNKGKELLYLNYAAVDPDLTNSKCSYWHFRLDADTSMKMEALTTFMKDDAEVKKVYLINQNYGHGQQVSKYAKDLLKKKRPMCRSWAMTFSSGPGARLCPYVAKIKQSGADTVITGNWGADLSLLLKAANDAGLNNVKFYTYYAFGPGPHGHGRSVRGQGLYRDLRALQHGCADSGQHGKLQEEVQRRPDAKLHLPCVRLAGCSFCQDRLHRPGQGCGGAGGHEAQELQRRCRDAQERPPAAARPVYLQVAEGRRQVPYDAENTGYTFAPVKYYEPYVASTPTSCQMKRPS
jgi:branched-chain amino acid transport system substrate-binding protein